MDYIIFWVYIGLSSTLGAWWLASQDVEKEEDDKITLFDVVGNIFAAVLFGWILFPTLILMMIKIKKIK
jgi:hypothetical protein